MRRTGDHFSAQDYRQLDWIDETGQGAEAVRIKIDFKVMSLMRADCGR